VHALVWTAPYETVLREEPDPIPDGDEIVAAVRAAGVCGSDLHGYRGHSPLRVPPLILGHEVVVADDHGDVAIVNPLIGCGACRLCAAGEPNLCPRRGLLGLDRPGAFAERVRVPRANLVPLPAAMSPLLGTLVEPLATPLNALRRCAVRDAVVAVLGCGPIGLLSAYAARALGARAVVCHDIAADRLRHVRPYADLATADAEELGVDVNARTGGLGADIVVDAVGVEQTWTEAIRVARPGATIAVIGLGQATGAVPVADVVRRGLIFRGVYAYSPDDFGAAVDMLTADPPALDWVATVSLEEGSEVLDAMARGAGPVKAVFVL
jgi:threonine dehydrogenase-like Zn-dependent dehydrogenase